VKKVTGRCWLISRPAGLRFLPLAESKLAAQGTLAELLDSAAFMRALCPA
jgi:hypothetical protein